MNSSRGTRPFAPWTCSWVGSRAARLRRKCPLRGFEKVPPAAPVRDLSHAVVAIVTGGGMVPKGNPDKLKQAFADAFGIYSIQGMDELPTGDFKGIHGGFDSTWVDRDPDRLVPVDVLRAFEKEGRDREAVQRVFRTLRHRNQCRHGQEARRPDRGAAQKETGSRRHLHIHLRHLYSLRVNDAKRS